MNRAELRSAALEIFQDAVRAVDARVAVRNAITIDGPTLGVLKNQFNVGGRPIYVVGIGKAAVSMSLGLNDSLGDRILRAVISSTNTPDASSLPATHTVFSGGHPIPNMESLLAAEAAFDLLSEANQKEAFVIFLISGGGSAMLESPISKDIGLADLQETNRQLILSGANISEINSVRRAISAVKGGRLAARLTNADFVTLIVSDTNSGDAASVASGPTLAGPIDAPDPARVIDDYRLTDSLPPSIGRALRKQKIDPSPRVAPSYVLLDNATAMEAAVESASELGFSTVIACDINEQSIDEGSSLLLTRAGALRNLPSCLISGGEFSCRVTGSGRGGRNLETVLRCAIKLDQEQRSNHTVVLSAGTDGIDGSSFAAGAIADETTIRRAVKLGLAPGDYLAQSDSHTFFQALDDLIITGPTGTNVRDLRLILRANSAIENRQCP